MSEGIIVSFSSANSLDLSLVPKNIGDSYIYFQIVAGTNKLLIPNEELRVSIVPHSTVLTSGDIQNLLVSSSFSDVPSSGIFSYKYTAIANTNINLLAPSIRITDYKYENTLYDLYWVTKYADTNLFGSNIHGVYSNTRNLKPNWITISGGFTSSGYVNYSLSYSGIVNEGFSYSGGIRPYALQIGYNTSSSPVVDGLISGIQHTFTSDYIYYGSGCSANGIKFGLPFFLSDGVSPASYIFNIAYVGMNGNMCTPVSTVIDHASFVNNQLKQLDSYAASTIDKSLLRYIDEIKIPKEISPWRKRLSIGIQDISVNQNVYGKSGSFISNQKILNYNIYTFSIRTDEYIPNYTGIDKYSVIKYYAEFGDSDWHRISPVNRDPEFEDGLPIPKMIVFDQAPSSYDQSTAIYYISNPNVLSYRIKIVFDLTGVSDQTIIPPEIRKYICVVSDRNKMISREV